ncbi:MAG: hypothetical protein RIR62_1020 [Pseudomonadota bacterium]
MDYVAGLIAARRAGVGSDHIHLGLTDPAAPPATLAEAQDAMAARHLGLLDLRDGQTVVDLGCGIGGSLRMIDSRLSQARLVGVNIDPRQIDFAAATPLANPVTWMCCDAAAFSDGRRGWADRILSLEAMFHFPDPAGVFAAAARALPRAGRMVVSTILLPLAPSCSGSVAAVCTGFAPWPHAGMTLTDLRAMGEAAGLRMTGCEDLAPRCAGGFDWMTPPPPPAVTGNPVTELRRLFECGAAQYPLMVFEPA